MLLDILKAIITKESVYEEGEDQVLLEKAVNELASEGEFTVEGISREVLDGLHHLNCKHFSHYEEEIDSSTLTRLFQVSPLLLLEATRTQGSYSDEEWDATLCLTAYRGDTMKKRLEQEQLRIDRAVALLHEESLNLQQLLS